MYSYKFLFGQSIHIRLIPTLDFKGKVTSEGS